MRIIGHNNEYLRIEALDGHNHEALGQAQWPEVFSILWFRDDHNLLCIDGVEHRFGANQMVFLTMLNQVQIQRLSRAELIQFNKEINQVSAADTEVGCKGPLFFGSSATPAIAIPAPEVAKFELLLSVILTEMKVGDLLQVEMLQVLLKRFLILSTRIYKEQLVAPRDQAKNSSIVREFNYLVECHYYEKHTVAEYAEILNKSPKTLANSFLKCFPKTPLQIIQERIVLEAKRQLSSTERTVSEIAYKIGFADIQTFSRFFKRLEGVSPREFRAGQN